MADPARYLAEMWLRAHVELQSAESVMNTAAARVKEASDTLNGAESALFQRAGMLPIRVFEFPGGYVVKMANTVKFVPKEPAE